MKWAACPLDVGEGGPSARMGHVAAVVDSAGSWQEKLLIFHGGLSEDKMALQDMAVLQLGAGSWLRPQPVKPGPPARSFHCGAGLSNSLYICGGHVWHRETREIRKFNDLWRLDTVRCLQFLKSECRQSVLDGLCMTYHVGLALAFACSHAIQH